MRYCDKLWSKTSQTQHTSTQSDTHMAQSFAVAANPTLLRPSFRPSASLPRRSSIRVLAFKWEPSKVSFSLSPYPLLSLCSTSLMDLNFLYISIKNKLFVWFLSFVSLSANLSKMHVIWLYQVAPQGDRVLVRLEQIPDVISLSFSIFLSHFE